MDPPRLRSRHAEETECRFPSTGLHTRSLSINPTCGSLDCVRAGRLFDGTEKLAANQVILIKGDRIVKVGPAEKVQVPADAEVVDLTHATVLPGLIDAHTHVFGNGPDFDNQILRDSYQYRTLTALANAQKDLMVGFTTLRDLKTLGAMYSDVDLRNAIDRGIVTGPAHAGGDQGNSGHGWIRDAWLFPRGSVAERVTGGRLALGWP